MCMELGGEISEKNEMSTISVQGGVEPLGLNLQISKSVNTAAMTPISVASSLSQSEEAIHVSFIHFNSF